MQSIPASYVSPITVHNGLLRGCAFIKGVNTALVSLFIDGKIQATVSANLPIPDIYRDSLGVPVDFDCGFIVPLPMRVFDGAKHELTVRVGATDAINKNA